MRFRMIGLLALALIATGCSRGVRSREIYFYNFTGGSSNISVDIIYPRDRAEMDRILNEFREDPNRYFITSRFETATRETTVDILPGNNPQMVPLRNNRPTGFWLRRNYKPFVLIIAEFGRRPTNSRPGPGQDPIIFLDDLSYPKSKKREHIQIHPGYMIRLERDPRGRGLLR